MKALYILVLLASFAGCGKRSDSSGGSSVGLRTITVKDAGSQDMGYLISWYGYGMLLMSPTGYFYGLNVDGTLRGADRLYFAAADCNVATPVSSAYIDTTGGRGSSKSLGFDPSGRIYAVTNGDADGTMPTGASVSYNSLVTPVSAGSTFSCSASASSATAAGATVISRAAAGIPDTITPPFAFQD